MKFSHGALWEAIDRIYRSGIVTNPRSSQHVRDGMEGAADNLDSLIRRELPRDLRHRFHSDEILDAWEVYGKSSMANGLRKKALTVILGKRFGWECFYAGRGFGECDDDVTIERIIPGTRGGKYTERNCFLACKTHNSMRGDKSLERFLEDHD